MAFEGSAFLFTQFGGSRAGFLQVNPETFDVIEVELDASISESHKFTADVTDNPVEGGSVVSDHITLKPIELTIDGMITDSPISFLTGVVDVLSGGESRSQQGFDALIALRDSRQLFTVQTGLRAYENMAMTSLTIPRRADIGQALRFQMQVRQLTIVESETVDIPPEQVAAANADAAQSEADKGKQSGSAASAATELDTSVLFDIFF